MERVREVEYCGTGWHIPGGIIRHGETIRERLKKTAEAELGFIPVFDDAPCKITEIFLEQEYKDHFISHLFRGRYRKSDVKTVDVPEKSGDLRWFDHYEQLVYSQAPYEEYLKETFQRFKKRSLCETGEYE